MTENHESEPGAIDVHQHLWPDELVDRLRARSKAPYLRGWTLYTDGEPPYDVDPEGHDVATRIAADRAGGGDHGLPQPLRPTGDRDACCVPRPSRSSTPGTAVSASCPTTSGPGCRCPRRTRASRPSAGCSTRTASSVSSCRPPTC